MRNLRRSLIGLLAVALFVGFMVVPSSTSGRGQDQARGNAEKFRRAERPVLNEYIVVLNDFAAGPTGIHSLVPTVAANLRDIHGGSVKRIYQHALQGFTIRLPEAAARRLSLDPRVAYVEEDSEITLSTTLRF